ncbi:hypothetical protein [Helicobacter pylori]|uniref:hypothetical protein n=1 Tax=Helicobacter pylori TaxID=210 RepID=UPI00197A82E2|nr:hypothetical protein [Helicobacter pylori]
MQDFINGFLKAWKAWSDDGKDAFLESFLDEVKNSKTDPSNFLGILEQEIKSLSQEGLKDDISSMLEVIESMKNEISHTKDNENVSDFMNVLQNEISQGQNNSNDNPSEFVESLAQAITETQENTNKNEIELTELERKEAELESKALQEHEENQIKRAEEISITENENELAKQELEKYALEGENKALESQNSDTLYEQQVVQEQSKEEERSNKQDLELETLRDNNIKKGLDDESLGLLESLQILRDETNEVANYLRANEIDYSRPTGENITSKIASLALEENNQLNEKETDTQEQAKHTEKEQEKPKIAPNNDIDLKDKYANLHSFFKQTELDIKQKRIKTKLDFKESFLNYAKNHMNEDELKVLLVVSQKEPTKLTKEHINLIKDCLEQAHGNKHMQDKGLQLSVKSILGHQLEKEHHEVLKDYLAKSKDSLEPMDNRVYEVMQKHLDKQQEKALKNLDSATQSVGVNANKNSEQPKNSQNEPRQETTNAQTNRTATQQEIQEKAQSNNSDEPWIEFGKKEQARAKAHYQAMLEKERAKQQAQQNAKNTNSINTPNKEVAIMDYGYTQSAPAKSRKR